MDLRELLLKDVDDEGCGHYIRPIGETCAVDMGSGLVFCDNCQLRFQAAALLDDLISWATDEECDDGIDYEEPAYYAGLAAAQWHVHRIITGSEP